MVRAYDNLRRFDEAFRDSIADLELDEESKSYADELSANGRLSVITDESAYSIVQNTNKQIESLKKSGDKMVNNIMLNPTLFDEYFNDVSFLCILVMYA